MMALCIWKIFLLNVWMLSNLMLGFHCSSELTNLLSEKDVLVLKEEENPKCFSRTEEDFTCFFETTSNKTYEIFYEYIDQYSGPRSNVTMCNMIVQRTKDGHFLHICPFPVKDVISFENIDITVVENSTNITIITSRIVCVEDQILLDPPTNVSLKPTGNVGELNVSYTNKIPKYRDDKMFKILMTSEEFTNKTEETKTERHLLKLPPGVLVKVQIAVKIGEGHWSGWSEPVEAAVPQSADDISLTYQTSDLQTVVCQWNGQTFGEENKFKLFYKIDLGEDSSWTECRADENLTDRCSFYGNESKPMELKLNNPSASNSKTFYLKSFSLYEIVKPSPPSNLKTTFKQDKLCLYWENPCPILQNHLDYEVEIKITGESQWRTLRSREAFMCEQIPLGRRFEVKVRSQPDGSTYSGSFSEWSDPIIGHSPNDFGMLIRWIIGFLIPIIGTIFVCILVFNQRKLRHFFWPPVPNLEKILHGFLTEMNKQNWDLAIAEKQCFEETTSSIVEIISESPIHKLGKTLEESTELLSSDGSSSSDEQVVGTPGTEVFPDYVTLDKDIIIPYPEGNSYVCELTREKINPDVEDEHLQISNCSCTDGSSRVNPPSDRVFANNCYLLMADYQQTSSSNTQDEKGQGNFYTNLPCS